MNICKRFFFFVLLLFSTLYGIEKEEYKLKAAFIARLPFFIEWTPRIEKNNKDYFVLLILGNNPFQNNLKNALKKVKNKPVKIIYDENYDAKYNADMIYIGFSDEKKLKKILFEIREKPIVTISDNKSLAPIGVHINFFIDGNRLRFDINKYHFRNAIHFNHRLLKLANQVFDDGVF